MRGFLSGTFAAVLFLSSILVMVRAGVDPVALAIHMAFFVACLTLIGAWESLAPWRERTARTGRRWRTNIGVLLARDGFTALLLPLGLGAVAAACAAHGIGLFNIVEAPVWVQYAATILVLDALAWLAHYLLHRVPTLWAIHEVHHSDEELDATSVLRGHPLEAAFRLLTYLAGVVALGMPAHAILLAVLLRHVFSTFHHGSMALPPRFEALLRLVIVTPIHHRIHHSAAQEDYDSNFAQIFSVWDRLFGTWREDAAVGNDAIAFGLGEARMDDPDDLWTLLVHPFRRAREANAAAGAPPARGRQAAA
ncbi:MAG: sterol desaturase family protein [Alphaproteobacteria bacterium]|nr:sterol desaturase family protein [Alphaproteobacteria bacterium]MDX5369122.1 sterol desaturase family protein [Alphaproteobacteria bacterium]MDX5463815.1 sterol desaturase family protein [Alphaproteobacteria bacterium]